MWMRTQIDVDEKDKGEQDKVVKGNTVSGMNVKKKKMNKTYMHGKRRSSERIKMNWFKRPIVGEGST
ncbi:hypothetical protein A2U01_0076186, partial [Trifolium medium]|nr:hypothetical protein [Trifolium medium]